MAGIDTMMHVAVSGLNTSQRVLQTTSTNIANVNTEGYQRKEAIIESIVGGGQNLGVQIAEIRRITDEFLQKQVQIAASDSERYVVQSEFHDRFQAILGSPESNLTLSGRLDEVFSALSALPLEPDALSRRSAVINVLQSLGDEMSRLQTQVQSLRREADRQIGDLMTKANAALTRIHDLNQKIPSVIADNGDASALIEQRDQALSELSEITDISTFIFGANRIGVAGAGGLVLIDHVKRQFSYDPLGTVTAATRFSQITANKVNPADGITESTGEVVDTQIQSGRLKGLLEMRDEVLPNFALELGEFAAKFVDQINAVHNNNATIPAPTTLTGRNTGLLTTDAHGFTGKVTLATMDSSSNYVNSIVVDFTNSTVATNGGPASAVTLTSIANVVTEVNSALGAGTLNFSNGALTFAAPTGASGVASLQDTTSPALRAGRGFSHFFGLNDLMEANTEPHFDTGLLATAGHGMATGGTVTLELRNAQNDVVKTATFTIVATVSDATKEIDDAGSFDDIFTLLENTANFGKQISNVTMDSNGAFSVSMISGFETYKLVSVSDSTNRGGTGVAFSGLLGVGDRYRAEAAKDVTVRSDIKSDPFDMALARLDITGNKTPAADSGAANAYVLDLSPNVTSLSAGDTFTFRAANANTGASTLVIDALGAVAIQQDGAALTGAEIGGSAIVTVQYDGTQFQLISRTAALSNGDASGAVAMQQIQDADIAFKAAGNLAAFTTQISAFAATVLSDFGNQAAINDLLRNDRQALTQEVQARLSSLSGVSMDEELANMVIFQNHYNASARLITAAREMFDVLISI
ncbi:MAG: flagellar hook-associated protein FlgK [Alphaproteobacteria bacterium]|jgi:flagellar hook-associated protein 1 FlgK|nr:flagellar hook-associated protein FlgK [Rhodospirillaceae bacterium]MDP6407426.1 flagellar hook-associated protein FlgK [Alphaproteobacteria bacterium]MDP6624227.1 flagellar hook-associated protein FlgK [Alphaproteobacteria bacterium]|tara:strand:+ start:1851 stop:4289 length:2439 start_codon:yes stop_codon:yes gene_type:complete